jgi:hypothetical protein
MYREGGGKRRSGWQSTAPPAGMTTIPNRAEIPNRRKGAGTVGKTPTARRILGSRKYAVARNTTRHRAPPERARHILDGDRWGGGHRHGTGRPGKTEFPSGWDNQKIIGHVRDVARAPDDPPVFQANRRWRMHGQREDVGINVIVQPDGRIWSAWPDAGSPGVVKNPRETP